MAGDTIENKWKDDLKRMFPDYFRNVKVLDIGSADINGTNRLWFENCTYVGLDIKPYKNVDVVSIAHEYDAPDGSFDVVCSTSELEHDMYWDKTIRKMVSLVRSGGMIWFAAGYKRLIHGTKQYNPSDSLTSNLDNEWADYYGGVSIEMVRSVLDLDAIFSKYKIDYSEGNNECDIHFWGIKK